MPRATKKHRTASDATGALASANCSAAVEAARMRLVGSACMYGAGHCLLKKCPELGEYEAFRRTMDEVGEALRLAAKAYFAAVCEPPNTRTEPLPPTASEDDKKTYEN